MLSLFMKFIMTLAFISLAFVANAGIVIGGTRVVYLSDKSDETISVMNKDQNTPYLIQAWVESFNSSDKSKPPFTVIPPISRLDPQQEKVLRIIKTQGVLPQDRESVFWLNIKSLPPASDRKNTNTLEIAIKTRLKFFWRPAALHATPESVAMKVKWRIEGRELVVSNPSPIHINVMNVSVDGKDVPLNMIPPFETLRLPLPQGAAGHTLIWHFINDFGAISQDINIRL
jgi:P pilus assembly chaperone PapD